VTDGRAVDVVSARRTILDADIHAFACLVGDFSPHHMDDVYAKESLFGARVLHAPAVFAISSGLLVQTGFVKGHIAFLGSSFEMVRPVFIGDSLIAEAHQTSVRLTSDQQKEIVEYAITTSNQHGDVVLRGTWTQMRPAADG